MESRQTRTASEKNLRTQTPSPEKTRLIETFGKLPLRFEANRGQTDSRVKFLSQGRGYTLFLTGGEAVLTLAKPAKGNTAKPARDDRNDTSTYDALRVKLLGANADPSVTGLDELVTKSNYFIGRDPKKWRTNVPNYGKVQYKDVYPGVDLVYYGNQRQLEYDWVVAPGADPRAIRFAIENGNPKFETGNSKLENGQSGPSPESRPPARASGRQAGVPNPESVRIDANGDLVISTNGGEVRFRKPVVYQTVAAVYDRRSPLIERRYSTDNHQSSIENRKFLDGRYVLRQSKFANPKSKIQNPKYEIAFEIAAYDPSKPLIIDPLLNFSTYLGGSGSDGAFGIAVDSAGNTYVTGGTVSTDFPVTSPVPQGTFGGAGGTCSEGSFFCGDAFVAKINAAGTALLYATYIGDSQRDIGFNIAVDSSGAAYVAGGTKSTNFPTTIGAFQATSLSTVSAEQAFVAKLAPDGSALVYSTYLTGSLQSGANHIALDSSGNAYVTGFTNSSDFPTTVGVAPFTFGGGTCGAIPCDDAFITKLNPTGTGLVYSLFLGGSGEDNAHGTAVDSAGNAYVTGSTLSTNFPTVNPFQTSFAGGGTACSSALVCGDAFVAKIDPTGTTLLYSTYLGGSSEDLGFGIAVAADADISGIAYVTGGTDSANFPSTSGVVQPTFGGGSAGCTTTGIACGDAFVTKIDTTATGAASLVYSTFLGGSGDEIGFSTAVDAAGNVHVAGETMSADFPITPGTATQPTFGGGTSPPCGTIVFCGDAFITKLNGTGTALIFSTYLGGSGDEFAGLALDSLGTSVYLAGSTTSPDFLTASVPVTSPLDSTCGTDGTCNSGLSDAFVAKLIDLALPVATVTPNPLPDFGTLGIGFSSSQTVTLKNNGDNSLGVFSIGITSDIDHPNASEFSISSGSCSLASFVLSPGASCTVDVTFIPAATGTRGALLEFTDNADGNPHIVTLTGTGAPAPAVSLSTSALFYAPRVIGTTSAGQPVTLTNTGTAPLSITSIGNTDSFAETDNCPRAAFSQTLAQGTFCTINVTFTPILVGSNLGSLNIFDDAPGNPHSVALSGTGLSLGIIGSSTTNVNFGTLPVGTTSGPKTVTLNNAGSGPLGISFVLSPTPPFFQTTNCGSSIGAGASCTFTLTYKPIVLGPVAGTLTINRDDSITPLVINLSGTGGPVPFARGEVFLGVGGGLVQRRNSTGTLIQNLTVSSGTFTTGMAFDSSGNLYVTAVTNAISKFDGVGNLLGTFGSGLATAESILFDAAGDAYVGDVGGGIHKFDSSGNPITTILPGVRADWIDLASDQKTMLYTQEGQEIHTVDVSTEVAGPDFATNLGGNAVALRFLLDGSVLLANVINVLHLSSSGTVIQTYTVPGESSWFALNLDPDGTSFWSANFNTSNVYKFDIQSGNQLLTFNTGTPSFTVFGLTVKGEITAARAPALTLSATALTMPDTPINLTCVPRTVTLTNTGQGTLEISSIATSSTEFIQTNTCPASLAAGANCVVSVVFHPAAIGTRTGTLTITSNAEGSPHVVTLSGEGKPLCLLQAVVPSLKVVEGTDSATFDVFHDVQGATELAEDPIRLACVDAAPVQCSFNPQTIAVTGRSTLRVENLRAVGGSSKALKVTGNSAEEKHTMWVQVLFADFSFTKYPNEASVKAGETASYAISIVPVNGLAGRMALKCTGVPVGTSCTVTPGEVMLAGGPVQVAVKVGTTQRGGIVRPPTEMAPRFPAPDSRLPIMLWSVLALLAAATGLAITKRKAKLALGLAMLCVLTWGSCGGGGGVGPTGWQGGTPLGTHTLVIQGTLTTPGAGMATDANTPPLTHETQITLKVN